MRIECLLFIHPSFGDARELRKGLLHEYVVSCGADEAEARALILQQRFDVIIVMAGERRDDIARFLAWAASQQPDADRLLLQRREDGSIASDFSPAMGRPALATPSVMPPARPSSGHVARWGALRAANRRRLS